MAHHSAPAWGFVLNQFGINTIEDYLQTIVVKKFGYF